MVENILQVLDLIERWQQRPYSEEACDALMLVDVEPLKKLAEQHAAQLRDVARFAADASIYYDRQWNEAAADFLSPRREPEVE